MEKVSNIIKSFAAGIMIALGGVIFLACDNKYIGAFLFSVGLFSVLVFGLNLYTGKVCDIANYKSPITLWFVWLCNAIGSSAVGLAFREHNNLTEAAEKIVTVKFDKTCLNLLIDAVLCGIFIAIAVYGYKKLSDSGRYLAIVFGVMGFILTGAEHIVADMFYLTLAHNRGVGVTLAFIGLVTLGNTLGGLLFALLMKSIECLDKEVAHGSN